MKRMLVDVSTRVNVCVCGALGVILLHHRGELARHLCFECADTLMRALAPENVRSGATVETTADGYFRWRETVGHPCTREEALHVANGSKPRTAS